MATANMKAALAQRACAWRVLLLAGAIGLLVPPAAGKKVLGGLAEQHGQPTHPSIRAIATDPHPPPTHTHTQ